MRLALIPALLVCFAACEPVGGTDTGEGETTCPVVDEITDFDVPCLCAGENVTVDDLPTEEGDRLFCEPLNGTYIQS